MATNLLGTVQAFTGGNSAVAGQGEDTQLTVSGLWNANDTFSIFLTNTTTGYQYLVGAGNVSNVQFTYCFTFNNKVYGLSGPSMYCSALASPTVWNDPNATGNGYITMSNWYATNAPLLAAVPYQGRLVFFSRRSAQIWITDPNISNWQQQQILTNIGTVAALSVQSLGDLDVLFLSDTGIRSLRVRDQSLNAYVNDIGSPIDASVQTDIQTASPTNSCAIVEPQANRYWCYVNGHIYVLSYFPSVKISAWSQYIPTFNNAGIQTAFVPQKFLIYNGQVYCRDSSNRMIVYGGLGNNVYDNCVLTAATTWLDAKKPTTRKTAQGLDVAFQGSWTFSMGMDPVGGTLDTIGSPTNSTFQYGSYGCCMDGFHVKFQAVTTGSDYARLSGLVFRYDEGAEK